MSQTVPRALTIAGSDSGGGAGIQADLKTFTALGVYGMSAITSVTAQNTQGVQEIFNLPPELVEQQMDSVLSDIGVDAVKIGMLSTKEIILAVSKKITEFDLKNLVLDPVMIAKGGEDLLQKEAEQTLIDELLPNTYLLTPNNPEAGVLCGIEINSIDDMKEAAKSIKALGPQNVLIKGGHLDPSQNAVDILYDGKEFYEFKSERINTKNTHGTGCTYSAAICAGLAKGLSLVEAIAGAKEYINLAIKNSFEIGSGHGPLNHFWKIL
ncbi:MAG: bifunctional hydroxymethylpyrimidine kinase/phosphomethylpyrimidine kinase [Thermodesulfobacteriota bacterium]